MTRSALSGAPETLPPDSRAGTVMSELGGDSGAAALYLPASWDGCEIEIRRSGAEWRGEHVAVRPRHVAKGTVYVAFFASLTAGSYEVRRRGEVPPIAELVISPATVTQVRLLAPCDS